ncbi:MAG: FKBP-type peptidyl-prolyl cis-trans isomerase [Bacteroidota bacterium]|nr:FKBP-type peptidyl-prolyl cis-trans isomerase [Bacteroidota bacterium]
MKRILLTGPLLCGMAFAQVHKTKVNHPLHKTPTHKAMTAIDSLSYAMGVQTAVYFKDQGASKINFEMIRKAYEDVYHNKTPLFSPQEADQIIRTNVEKFMAQKVEDEKLAGKKFLEQNRKKPGVVTLDNGLQYEVLTRGTGPIPTATDTVQANYVGTLLNGKEFDNSYKRGEPITIPVTGVIRGWTEALELMPVGSKWRLFIPSDLAYGDRGAGAGAIPGGATLVFEIELLGIVHKN